MISNGVLSDESLRAMFGELAGRSVTEREEYYRLAKVSTITQEELESLLTFDRTSDSIGRLVGSAAEDLLLSRAPVTEGGRCGSYRLGRLLGHGGMGSVYLAERADGEIDQQVAIKFLRPGAELPSFRERF